MAMAVGAIWRRSNHVNIRPPQVKKRRRKKDFHIDSNEFHLCWSKRGLIIIYLSCLCMCGYHLLLAFEHQ